MNNRPDTSQTTVWRLTNTITDWEFKQIGALLCDHLPRDLALKIVRLQGQLEVAKEMARTRREPPPPAMRETAYRGEERGMSDENRTATWRPTHRLLAQAVRLLGRGDDRVLVEYSDGSIGWIDGRFRLESLVPVDVVEREALHV